MVARTQSMFPHFLKRTGDVLVPRLSVVFQRLHLLGCYPACWMVEIDKCHPNSNKFTILLCRQLPTDFHNMSVD